MRAPIYAALLFSIACSTETTTTQPGGESNGGSSGTAPPPSNTSKPVDPGPVTDADWPTNTSCSPGSDIYQFKPTRLFENDEFPLCAFQGRVLFIVNGASFCG